MEELLAAFIYVLVEVFGTFLINPTLRSIGSLFLPDATAKVKESIGCLVLMAVGIAAMVILGVSITVS